MSGSWRAETFDRLYAASDDPWSFATGTYEKAKYAATLAALPPGAIACAFEAGCSVGVLTRGLAERCDHLLAVDVSDPALRLARARCSDRTNVTFARMALPHDWPDGRTFDLMVFSEILYFLDAGDVRLAASRAVRSLNPGGTVILVDWTGDTNTPTTGEAAAELFIAAAGLPAAVPLRAPGYRLDVLHRPPAG